MPWGAASVLNGAARWNYPALVAPPRTLQVRTASAPRTLSPLALSRPVGAVTRTTSVDPLALELAELAISLRAAWRDSRAFRLPPPRISVGGPWARSTIYDGAAAWNHAGPTPVRALERTLRTTESHHDALQVVTSLSMLLATIERTATLTLTAQVLNRITLVQLWRTAAAYDLAVQQEKVPVGGEVHGGTERTPAGRRVFYS